MTETRPDPSLPGFNEQLIEQFRAHRGQIPDGPFAGAPILLLGTTGARSGQPRTNPLAYSRDGERYVIIASKGGAPSHPDWYHNLRANPIVTVEVGGERFRAQASVAEGSERERLYAQQAKQMPGFAEYQRKTSRQIPVVTLDRLD